MDVGFVVLKGVVYFGYLLNVILWWVVCFIYGVLFCLKFKLGEYLENKKIIVGGMVWCKDVLYFFLKCGE